MDSGQDDFERVTLLGSLSEKRTHRRRVCCGAFTIWRRDLCILMIITLAAFYISSLFAAWRLARWSLSTSSKDDVFLPQLNITPLGPIQRVYEPQAEYRLPLDSMKTTQAWSSLFPEGNGYVSLPKILRAGPVADYIKHQSTDGSGRFGVAAFHQLHCLQLMLTEFYEALYDSRRQPSSHTLHCYDYVRTSVMCAADSTLEPMKGRFDGGGGGDAVDGFGSVHQCRDFEALFDWAETFRWDEDDGGNP